MFKVKVKCDTDILYTFANSNYILYKTKKLHHKRLRHFGCTLDTSPIPL